MPVVETVQPRKRTLPVTVYRFITGLEMDAVPRTDATWLDRGTRIVHPDGRAYGWHFRPRIQRAGIRLAWTTAVLADVALALTDWPVFVPVTLTAASTACLWAVVAVALVVVRFGHRRRVVRPLAKALAVPLETDPVNVLRGLVVPLRVRRDSAVVVPIPDGWHGDRKLVQAIVSARLGGDWSAEWRLLGAPFSVRFSRVAEPPRQVLWRDALQYIESAAPNEVLIGLDNLSRPKYANFEVEEPMWGLSVGSGGGKSVFLWGVAAQLIRQGASITAIDPKMISLEPLSGIPGVELHDDPRDVQAMWDAIRRFRQAMEDRYEQWRNDHSIVFRRMVLLIEEGNMFSDLSREYWRTIRSSQDPMSPPVWQDIAAILRMGRQANANVIAVFQRMDSNATGGQGLRDYFGFRILGRFTHQQWRMLVGTTPVPKSQKRRGRFLVVEDGDPYWIQSPLSTAEEIRDFCLTERERQGWTDVSRPSGTDAVTLDDDRDRDRDTEPRYTIPEAVRAEVVPMTYEALRKARQRDPDFPPADLAGKYAASQLQGWYRERTYGK